MFCGNCQIGKETKLEDDLQHTEKTTFKRLSPPFRTDALQRPSHLMHIQSKRAVAGYLKWNNALSQQENVICILVFAHELL